MSELKDLDQAIISGKTGPIDIPGLAGLSALLTSPLSEPCRPEGERRTGFDRRVGDRRTRAREFSAPE